MATPLILKLHHLRCQVREISQHIKKMQTTVSVCKLTEPLLCSIILIKSQMHRNVKMQ